MRALALAVLFASTTALSAVPPPSEPFSPALRIPAEVLAGGLVAGVALGGGFALMQLCEGVPCFGAIVLSALTAHVFGTAAVIHLVGDLLGGSGRFDRVLMGTGSAVATSLILAAFIGAAVSYSGGSDQTTFLTIGSIIGGGPVALGVLMYEVDSHAAEAARHTTMHAPGFVLPLVSLRF